MELTSTTKNGVSAYHLMRAAEILGFQTLGVEGEVENIKKEDLPCIAHVIINKKYQHFLVLYDINLKNKKVTVMDPAKGKRILSLSEFKLMTSFKYILLKPNKKLPNFIAKKVIANSFLINLRQNSIPTFIIISLSILYAFFNILTAYHFKYLLEYALTLESIENLIQISGVMIFLFLLKESISIVRNITLLKWSNIFDFSLTSKILEQIISFPYLYYKNRTTGEILSRMKDLSVVKNFIATTLSISIPELVSLFTFLTILFSINAHLASYSLIFLIILFGIELLLKTPHKKKLKRLLRQEEKINSHLIEIITAFDVVKGLHMEEHTNEKFQKKYLSFLDCHYILFLFYYIEEFLKNNIYHIMMTIILLLGGRLVITKKLSLSELIIFQSILSYSVSSFQTLSNLLKNYREYRVSKERVEDLFTIHKESFAMKEYFERENLKGMIEYKNFSFSYNSKPLFSSLNLKIPYKNKVFIYGESGFGKSTLVKTLMRYIEVPYGNIKINGIDINHYHLSTLRRKITYVSQNEYLFTDTMYENMVMKREIEKEKVLEIASKMCLDEVIEKLPLGLETMIEENGFNLSGGERQRLILARSILKDSDIYIFDESSSQIDIEKERKILKNMFHMLKDKTIIVISHRFDNKDLFNQIIHIEKGKCYEEKV